MGKYHRKTNQRRAYLKQFSSSMVKPRKSSFIGGGVYIEGEDEVNLLKDYHSRAENLQRDMAGNILPFNPPLSRITQQDILRWKDVKAPPKESSYFDKEGKKVVVENFDACPPRIRVMIKLKQTFTKDCYCVSIIDGQYLKVDLFFGCQIFFVRENVLAGTFEKSMTFSSREGAKKSYFERPTSIVWFPVG